MTPDDPVDRLERDYKALLQTYGALDKAQSLLTAELDRAVSDQAKTVKAMEGMRRELLDAIGRSESRQSGLVQGVKASCDKGWGEMAAWVEKYEKHEAEKRERDLDRASTNLISKRMAIIGTFAAIISAVGVLVAALALILSGGG